MDVDELRVADDGPPRRRFVAIGNPSPACSSRSGKKPAPEGHHQPLPPLLLAVRGRRARATTVPVAPSSGGGDAAAT
jgi:hypothetical protein